MESELLICLDKIRYENSQLMQMAKLVTKYKKVSQLSKLLNELIDLNIVDRQHYETYQIKLNNNEILKWDFSFSSIYFYMSDVKNPLFILVGDTNIDTTKINKTIIKTLDSRNKLYFTTKEHLLIKSLEGFKFKNCVNYLHNFYINNHENINMISNVSNSLIIVYTFYTIIKKLT